LRWHTPKNSNHAAVWLGCAPDRPTGVVVAVSIASTIACQASAARVAVFESDLALPVDSLLIRWQSTGVHEHFERLVNAIQPLDSRIVKDTLLRLGKPKDVGEGGGRSSRSVGP